MDSPEYRSWISARRRCDYPRSNRYHLYGARGITMCPEWREDFPRFLADMGPRPPGTSLDRIDNDRGYEPGNCRWATAKEQANNRRPRPAPGLVAGPVRTYTNNRAHGERSANAKLSADLVREIRQLYAAGGITQTQLAQRFGVDQSNISAAVLRQTWAHVA